MGLEGEVTFPDLSDLNAPLRTFLDQSVRYRGGDTLSMRALMVRSLCYEAVKGLLDSLWSDPPEHDVIEAILAECKVADLRAVPAALGSEQCQNEIGKLLEKELLEQVSDRPMLSFFIAERPKAGFLAWHPGLETGIGHSLKSHTVTTPLGPVQVSVSRYEEHDGDDPVTAYEWTAKLIQPGAAEPDAVASGMVYVIERDDGDPQAGKQDLLEAADQVADTDVLQMAAFFDQHGDANDVISSSDLCFVWIWERRGDAPKGSGAACLTAALENLQKRFKRVKTAIFDTRPVQFRSWDLEQDPPMVQVAKQNAIEQLVSYVETLTFPRFNIRHIFNHHEGDPDRAMAELARGYMEDREKNNPTRLDADDDELVDFLESAGLQEMAERLVDNELTVHELHAVLRHTLLVQRIPFLPASIRGASQEWSAAGKKSLDIDEAIESDEGVYHLVRSVPRYADAERAWFIPTGGTEDEGRWLVLVSVQTAYGSVEEYFTTIPVPRPIDATRLLAD